MKFEKKLCMAGCMLGLSVAMAQAIVGVQREGVDDHFVSHPQPVLSEPVKIDNLFPGHGLTDPHAWIEDGRLYLFAGRDISWKNDRDWLIDCWEIWSTDNLYDWNYESAIWPKDNYMGEKGNCWAGDIAAKDGTYYWYFSNKNMDIGVMVSDSVNTGYRDALGHPLLAEDTVPSKVYDPDVFVEDGKYYIIFGAGGYYIAQLADDMISLAEEPKYLLKGGDKPTTFKRNGIYYLFWDNSYVMSDSIYGPYSRRHQFVQGGHSSVFEWNGQWYMLTENNDIGYFFRGISLKPLFFNEDGTVIIPPDDMKYPGARRDWTFEHAAIAWQAVQGTTLEWDKAAKSIKGEISGYAVIQPNLCLMNEAKNMTTFRIRLKNQTAAKQAKVTIVTGETGRDWRSAKIDWDAAYSVVFDLSDNHEDFVDYKIQLDNFGFDRLLKTVRIEPALGVEEGSWEIDSIGIE
ncbi:family 43 glycosylhydrolase [Pontiella sulfatireligans]|uniref:Xylosidase/arabinosidase n=1 Tax=Pontiella sulfatireligans TaxID=2750658 RepID=A0A6C2UG26_9BACT|nr:family 43 glycosylhydrolase [Pontiella sulfatireligans]VGO18869.1 Xylosidase/arabinosidase [Pontiella sulfatireligans]